MDTSKIAADPRCDFCNASSVAWCFPAGVFSIRVSGKKVLWDGDWLACEECAQLILRNDRQGLAARSSHYTTVVREIHDNFWRVREGPPTPL